jgi:hypothetical protein
MKLTQEEARSIILARQGLGQGGRYATPAEALRALVAVQTQYPASLAPALAARADKVTARTVERALAKEKTFLKGWNLRSTLHTSLAADHMMMVSALGRRIVSRHAAWLGGHGIDAESHARLNSEIMAALSSRPLGRKELHEQVPFFKGASMVGWGLDAMGLSAEGKVVLAHQAAAKTQFARLDQWAPHIERCPLSEEEAFKELARRYFAGYGPATIQDFFYWTGSRFTPFKVPLNAVKAELTPVSVEGLKGAYFVYGAVQPGCRLPLRLLPKFDPLMMGRKDKTLFLPDKLRSRVFRPAGQVEAVVVAGGQVRGTWRTVRKGTVLEFMVEPFGRLNKAWISSLPREAMRAAKALGFSEISVSVKP